MIDSVIFRAYDLRGIYPEQINEDTAYKLGQSFGSYVQRDGTTEVLVAYDNRLSSPILESRIISGLISTGVNVIRLGLVTTPMFYFARFKLNKWAGIMITASHNPKEYNGFKISFTNVGNAAGQEIVEFKDFTLKNDFITGNGSVSEYDIIPEYLDLITNNLHFGERKIKVVFDCGNGTCSVYLRKILEKLPIEYDLLYCDSDGTFPNHHPDPSVSENLIDLQNRIIELNYDLGIALDADGDRVRVIDEKGNIIDTDVLMIIFYRHLNEKLKVRKALFDVKCSRTLIDELNKLNIEPIMWRTGNSYHYRKFHEENLDFSAEYSGHVFFGDRFHGIDDGLYAGLRLAELLSLTNKNLSELYTEINHYYSTDEIKFEATEETKFDIVSKVKEYALNKDYQVIDIDGVRVEFPDGWALIRASNTGPNLTVRFESISEQRLKEIEKEFMDLLNDLKS